MPSTRSHRYRVAFRRRLEHVRDPLARVALRRGRVQLRRRRRLHRPPLALLSRLAVRCTPDRTFFDGRRNPRGATDVRHAHGLARTLPERQPRTRLSQPVLHRAIASTSSSTIDTERRPRRLHARLWLGEPAADGERRRDRAGESALRQALGVPARDAAQAPQAQDVLALRAVALLLYDTLRRRLSRYPLALAMQLSLSL